MRIILLTQYILVILFVFAALGMMVASFINNSVPVWKGFTIIIFIVGISLLKVSRREFKNNKK